MFDEYGYRMLPLGAFEPRAGGGMRLHGGGGSSAPPPDPRLVEAQIRSMGIQDEMIKKIVEQSEAMQPLQREQLQFGLDAARTAQEQAQADRAYSLERRDALSGLQDQLIADAKSFNQGARSTELRAEATADVNSAFSNAAGQAARAASRMGINPNSGRASAIRSASEMAQASALAGATSKANDTARAEGYALTDRATNALAGYPAMGMQTTGAGAQYGTAGLTIANQGVQGLNSGYTSAAQVAGQMGSNANSMYGSQSSAHVNGQGADNTGALIGAAGGIAVAFI